jgi:hypothetical protein
MSNDLSKDPDEEHAWSRAQSDCITYQQKHGSLTIEVTSQAMQTALDILVSHTVRQRHRRKKRLSQRKDEIKIKTLVTELLRMETKKFGSQRNSRANGQEEQEISDGWTGTVHSESIIFIFTVCPSGVEILPWS